MTERPEYAKLMLRCERYSRTARSLVRDGSDASHDWLVKVANAFDEVVCVLTDAAQDAAVLAKLREMAEERFPPHARADGLRRPGLLAWLADAARAAAQAVTPPEAPDA